MTRSLYIIGAPGSGKSTLLLRLLADMEMGFGEVEEFHSKPNKKALVKLRGQRLYHPDDTEFGVYLGVNRPEFPGADALDNATSPVGAEWLAQGGLPRRIVGEGLALTTRPFLEALHQNTQLLLIHLQVDPEEQKRRFAARGSAQNPGWVAQATTRCANSAEFVRSLGGFVCEIDSTSWAEDEVASTTIVDLLYLWLK